MSLVIPVRTSSLATLESFSKIAPTKLVGMALGYSVYEKLAQIIKTKFPAIPTAHLPYMGLISGAFADSQVIVIYAIALLILIPIQKCLTTKKESLQAPSFMKEMAINLKNCHYIPPLEKIDRVGCILNKCEKRNVLILGKPGVGKTALVESIIQMQLSKDASLHVGLAKKKFYQVSCTDIMSGTTLRGELEERIQKIFKFAATDKNIVLVFDEIHQLALANRGVDSGIGILDFFKERLARDKLSVIGMTTEKEYKEHLATDTALTRRFTEIYLKEHTSEENLAMLKGRAQLLLRRHSDIKIQDDTIYDYTLSLVNPGATSSIDQAFDLLDTAFSVVSFTPSAEKVITKETIDEINRNKKEIQDVIPVTMYS